MHDPQQQPPPNAARAATWRRYLRFWGPRAEADVDDELGFHIEMRVRDYLARGLTETEARREAERRIGNLAAVRAACVAITSRRERRMTRAQVVDALVHDARFAYRTLRRQKGWTAVAVLTLALGIGANTAVFSVVNALLLHPLPYPDADRMVIIYQEPTRGNNTGMQVLVNPNADVVRAWREGARSFDAIEAYTTADRALRTVDGASVTLQTGSVLPSFPAFTGQRPLLGRVFTEAEIAGARVAMISEPFWRVRYGADPGILGKSITLDREPYTVIGVMPAAFRLPRRTDATTDVWLPLDLRDRSTGLSVIGRLRPGATMAAATRELDALDPGIDASNAKQREFAVKLAPPSELVRFRASLVLLSAAVALVLLIACGNVTHLMLARTASRQRELAIRAALGASRLRLARQLLTESLILAAVGCVGGLLVGWLGLHAIVTLRPDHLSELVAARIDRATLVVTAALATGTGLVVGLLGAIQTRRHSAHGALKAGTLSASQSRGQRRLRSLLVISEMAVSTVLLVGAMLLVRSMLHLQRLDPGFDATGLYSVQLALPRSSHANAAARAAFMTQAAERVRAVPGVGQVTVAAGAPPSRNFLIGALQVEGEPAPARGTTSFVNYNGIEPDYFRTIGIRLVEGTTITDTSSAAAQVIVNAGFAKKYWPGKSAVGRRLRVVFNGDGEWLTIVGVAANAFTGGLTSEADTPMLYVRGEERFQSVLIVRTEPGSNPVPTIRALVAQLDPALPPATITSIDDAMARTIAGPRFTMTLLVAFTALALVLAAVGLYGVMAYTVAQRTREIGIRIALGATRRDVARSVVAQGVALALTGAVLGVLGARAGSALLEDMLYGVARTDAVSFTSGVLLLVATAALACLVPMRRAMAVDPLIAIRAD